jgi:hypothetical protein
MAVMLLFSHSFLDGSANAQCIAEENQKILALDGNTGERFAYSLAVQGSLLVVGRPDGNFNGTVHVFNEQGSSWVETQMLTASDGAGLNIFGDNVALDGQRLLVGSPGDNRTGLNQGSAYVFHHDGTQWVEEQKLVDQVPDDHDFFADAVAIEGSTAVVCVSRDHLDSFHDTGSVRIFRHDGSQWQENQLLKATVQGHFTYFGSSCSLDGDTLLVGQVVGDGVATDTGAAYVFRDNGTAWILEQHLFAIDGALFDQFGTSVALDGDVAVIGANHTDQIGASAGAAYVFRRSGTTWIQEQRLEASDASGQDFFGLSVAIRGDRIVVGAQEFDPPTMGTGFAYLFQFDGSQWVEVQKLLASDREADDSFGWQVALSADQVFCSSRDTDADTGVPQTGALYVYDQNDLALQANQQSAQPGDLLNFLTCGGLSGGIVMLFVTDINSSPLFVRAATGSLDSMGSWSFGGTVPPGLVGVIATFQSFGFYQPGKIGSSAEQVVAFF